MDYRQWVKLFGRTTDDDSVRAALAKAGVTKLPTIAKDETDTRVELGGGLMLIFTHVALFPDFRNVGDGQGVLTEVVLWLRGADGNTYMGTLPFNLQIDDSQQAVRNRFGDPVDENQRFRWDEWELEGLLLNVTYTKSLDALETITIRIPIPD